MVEEEKYIGEELVNFYYYVNVFFNFVYVYYGLIIVGLKIFMGWKVYFVL